MDDVVSPPPTLRRRNSIPASPSKLVTFPRRGSATTTSSSSDDLELLTVRPAGAGSHSYTSLRDLLPPAAVNSPKPKPAVQPGSDICIRNRLVKQAAWAYLQPMSSSPRSDGGGFLRHLWPRIVSAFDFVRRGVVRMLSWMLRIGSR